MCAAKHWGAAHDLKSDIRERAAGRAQAGGTGRMAVYGHALEQTLLLCQSAPKHQNLAFETPKRLL